MSQIEQPNGSASEPFCSNGIVECVPSGKAWSTGSPRDNCGSGLPSDVDAGPAGAFCCGTESIDAAVYVSAD